MRNIIYLSCFVVIVFAMFYGQNVLFESPRQADNNSIKASRYLEDKGYRIISSNSLVSENVLLKEDLLKLPFNKYWGLQSVNPSDYLYKTIQTYSFIVKDHPLDNYKGNKDKQTAIWVMVCGNEIIGGYSSPVTEEDLYGGVYSLEGKTLEEATGLSYQEWQRQWSETYR